MPQKKKVIPASIYLFKQVNSVKNRFPTFLTAVKKNKLCVQGELQPSPMHMKYKFRIIYAYKKMPIIDVIEPKIKVRDGCKSVPHVYEHNRPCLYYPKNQEFTHDMMISETIIPWLSLWLYFYEIWYTTGKWLGEGVHEGEKEDS